MIKSAVAMMALALSVQECDFSDLDIAVSRPGTITVTNVSESQTAVIAIIAGDVKSYPTLAAGGTASATTNVGGTYEVRVVMTPESAAAYRSELQSLRSLVEKTIDRTTNPGEKTQLFIDLAGIKAAIQGLENQNAAACSGTIGLSTDAAATVSASVRWSQTSASGFWDVTCGSS